MLKQTLLTLTIFAVTSLAIFQPAHALVNEVKLTASDAAMDDLFGHSVSISDDYSVVGAIGDDDKGSRSGSAYVYKRSGTTWVEEAKLLPDDGAADDQFGISVSIDGDYAVAGAFGDDDNGDFSGSAYVFKRSGTTWAQEDKLLPTDGAALDGFGNSVSISGDYAIVGAENDQDNGFASGSAYIFKRTGTTWVQEDKLLPTDGATLDRFGVSVSISGDYAIVGAIFHGDNGLESGSAYVFKRTGTTWVQEDKLLHTDGAAGDQFGVSVSIDGDYAVVGAYLNGDNGLESGSAYVFKRTGTTWLQEDKLLPTDAAEGDQFGRSVSISGDYVVVGAVFHDDNGTESGSAYLFKRSGTSWSQEAILLASDGAAYDEFGLRVSISGDYAVVGAQNHDDNGTESGSAYVYNGFTLPVGVESEIGGLPTEFTLSQNYPNPFNPVTVIGYALPIRSDVKLTIYNLRGEEVALLINGTVSAGNHRVIWDASNMASGVYIYKLIAGDFVQTRKMVLLK